MADLSPLVPIATAAIGAASALLGVWLQSHYGTKTRELNEKHARDRQSREWAKDTYVRLVEAIDRAERGMGRGRASDENTLPDTEPTLWKEEGGRLIAEVTVLGSSQVKELVDRFQAEHVDFYFRLDDIHQLQKSGEHPTEEMKALMNKRKDIFALARKIEAQVHLELRARPDSNQSAARDA